MDSITILTTTYYPDNELGYQRLENFLDCKKSWRAHLKYDGIILYMIADDGTHINGIIVGNQLLGDTKQERKGVGASLNAGFKAAFERSDVVMYIVDDWRLNDEIEVDAWVNLLKNNERIGMVRIGPPHPDLTGKIEMFNEGFGLVLNRHNYAYAMRPALYHKRFFEAYGWFQEGINCWDCERIYNERFCSMEGPEIVYALPMQWEHIDTLPLGQLEPKGEGHELVGRS